ncbi:hypothetical protein GCM10010389_44560 [Streptomyces echinoruber]|uniref:Uncharacterized protein n=1 Tax=Streptomyces echinoruber TaxID=68898 RepID=A0A918RHP3_9ACTN|nr:hypothetical protein GCM10010389_44560 [Streptomyces echinoruber]
MGCPASTCQGGRAWARGAAGEVGGVVGAVGMADAVGGVAGWPDVVEDTPTRRPEACPVA